MKKTIAAILAFASVQAFAAGAGSAHLVANFHTKQDAATAPKNEAIAYVMIWGVDQASTIEICRGYSDNKTEAARCRVVKTVVRDGSDFSAARLRVKGPITDGDENRFWVVKKHNPDTVTIPAGSSDEEVFKIWNKGTPSMIAENAAGGSPECRRLASGAGRPLYNTRDVCSEGATFIESMFDKFPMVTRHRMHLVTSAAELEKQSAELKQQSAELKQQSAEHAKRADDARRRKAKLDRELQALEAQEAAASGGGNCSPDGQSVNGPFKSNPDLACGYRIRRCQDSVCYYTKY